MANGRWIGLAHPNPSPELLADFKGDGSKFLVLVYNEVIPANNLERTLPVITKVFSDNSGCYRQVFSYDGKGKNDRSGNEFGDFQLLKNFWGNGKDVVMVLPVSTAYGSGWRSPMNFIAWVNGSFEVVEGPTLGDLTLYKFSDTAPKGSEILIAKAVWGADEGHFGLHKYKFIKYNWDGTKYVSKDLGTTLNKYPSPSGPTAGPSSVTIDQIIKTEPSVLK